MRLSLSSLSVLLSILAINSQARNVETGGDQILHHHKCASGEYPPNAQKAIQWYTLDLDKSARTRWQEIAKDKAEDIAQVIRTIKNLVRLIEGEKVILELEAFFTTMWAEFPWEYRMEMLGISEASGVSLGDIVMLNTFYESSGVAIPICTSIIAQTDKGYQIHGRNMDFGEFFGWDFKEGTWKTTENLRMDVINVEATKGGETVWKSVTYAGYIGIFTGVRKGHFSVTINSREGSLKHEDLFMNWVKGDRNMSWTTLLPRQLFESGASFDEAVYHLSYNQMIMWEYYIVSGPLPGQGVVITRNVTTAVDQWWLDIDSDLWYLLETNYDHWRNPPFFDDRRDPGMKCMDQWNSTTIDKSKIYDVLSTNPVLNKATVYTVLMHVSDGSLESYVRNCRKCWFW